MCNLWSVNVPLLSSAVQRQFRPGLIAQWPPTLGMTKPRGRLRDRREIMMCMRAVCPWHLADWEPNEQSSEQINEEAMRGKTHTAHALKRICVLQFHSAELFYRRLIITRIFCSSARMYWKDLGLNAAFAAYNCELWQVTYLSESVYAHMKCR